MDLGKISIKIGTPKAPKYHVYFIYKIIGRCTREICQMQMSVAYKEIIWDNSTPQNPKKFWDFFFNSRIGAAIETFGVARENEITLTTRIASMIEKARSCGQIVVHSKGISRELLSSLHFRSVPIVEDAIQKCLSLDIQDIIRTVRMINQPYYTKTKKKVYGVKPKSVYEYKSYNDFD